MAKIEKEDNKFTWGDPILIKKDAPNSFHPGEFASICGMYKITYEETAKEYQTKVNDWLYIVEFEDGSSIEVPECYLEPYKEE